MKELSFRLEKPKPEDGGKTSIEIFEGPLDLMLSLITKHKLDIQDIEIAVLLEQFLGYIEEAGEQDIELAGEFLEMAARLIYIKTMSLLPKHEAEKLKRELEGTLIEYALCKATAEMMRERYIGDLLFTRPAPELKIDLTYDLRHDAAELAAALSAVADRDKLKQLMSQPPSPESFNPAVNVTYVSVFSKILYVLRKVRRGERVNVPPLFAGQTRSEQVATFLALLELSSHGRIAFSDEQDYIELKSNNEVRK